MEKEKWWLLVINILGGTLVLGSYVLGFRAQPNATEVLWGGVPQVLRPFYSTNMFIAAAGYLAFTYFILFRLDPKVTRITSRWGYNLFNLLYASILFPSALWLPLTFAAVASTSTNLLWAVRIVLAVVGLASLGMLYAVWTVKPPKPAWSRWAAVIGCVAFCVQTVLMDAVIWSTLFSV
jgi:hypothetical protein